MRLTNNKGLPDVFCSAVDIFEGDYDKGKADFTPTQLNRPVRITVLLRKHWKDLEEDVSDRLWTLSGQVGHLIFERVAKRDPERYVAEQRLYATVNGYIIGGRVDLYDKQEETLWDYKNSSVWKFLLGDTWEWETQLNINALCVAEGGKLPVKKIRVLVQLKDWKLRESKRRRDYPDCPVHIVDIPIWDKARTEGYIMGRISALQDGADNPPVCTPDERWERGGKFAVMKQGRKSAVRLFDTSEEADILASTDPKFYVEERRSEPTRCIFYCPVWKFCTFGLSAHDQANGATPEPVDLPLLA
jgi:hypothetical protein